VSATLVREQDRVPEGTIYALPTDGYQLVNLELGAQSLNIGGRRVDAGLEVKNVFNTAYRDYLSRYKLFVDDPGRDVVLRFRMPFGGRF
jgi:iron complex outermembrane receptor protein